MILNQSVTDAKERKQPLAVILMDIDNFKKINDTYGHPAGDMVLKKAAQEISRCFRVKRASHQVDFAARYGGEEFIIMLRGAALQDAGFKVAERVRQTVEKAEFDWEGVKIPVTLSLGVAMLHEDENVPDLMVRRADEALYRAKKAGKNRVCLETFAAS
jgi:diguanylate cyclase (GGDEF)-like protein